MADNLGLTIRLLGAFHITTDDFTERRLDSPRLRELLTYLLLRRDQPVSRQQLAFLFWPDSSDQQAQTNLRTLWHRLRHALPDAGRYLVAHELSVQWHTNAACRVDLIDFETGLTAARTADDPALQTAQLEQAVAVYRGELLPGHYSDWLLVERERLAQAYAAALTQLAALYEARQAYREAIGRLQTLLRHNPLDEPAYAQLMRLHALNGDRAAALHAYHNCATVLRRELDTEPATATRALYERLFSAAALPAAAGAPAVALIGRGSQSAQLQHAWRAAAQRPQIVLITGEAGIGKTRLAEALVDWVGRQGLTALTARCYAAGGDLAYAPVVTWLHTTPRPALADAWLRELARLLPEIGVERPDLPPPAPLVEPWQRLRLFEALAQALLSGHHALLLLLDDLQWCDRDTLDWLHYLLLARYAGQPPTQLLVVATLRTEEEDANPALAAWRTVLAQAERLSTIELAPLDEAATLSLATQVAGRPLDQALGALLWRGTEGHPLYIVEMVRAGFLQTAALAASHGAGMTANPVALPDKVRRVLNARLAQLSAPARGVIELAAVVGRAFAFDVLAAASDLDEPALVTALDECWRRRIIREQGADGYDFSHDKLREAAYAALSQTRRRWLHAQVAHALAPRHADALDAVAGIVAAHYQAAGRPAQAVACYRRAADVAQRVYAYNEALAALTQAIALLPDLPAAERPPLTAALTAALGDVYQLRAQPDAARAAYQAALACVPTHDGVAQAQLQRKIGAALKDAHAEYAEVATCYARAGLLLGPPHAARDAAWWEVWCAVQLDFLLMLYWWNRTAEMGLHLAEVQPLIEQHGTPLQRAALFSSLSRKAIRAARFAPSDDALAYARAALAALPADVAPEISATYRFSVGFYRLWHGDLAAAEADLLNALHTAEATGDIALQTRCLVYLTIVWRRQGNAAASATGARRALALATASAMFDYIGIGAGHANLAWIAWREGDHAEAARLGRAALEAWQRHPASYPLYWQALWPLIGAALAQSRLSEAVGHAQRLCDPAQQILPADLAALLSAALAAWDAGQPADADRYLHSAVARARQTNHA